MIDYGSFVYAGPPRSGTTYFMKVMSEVGLGDGFKAHVHQQARDSGKLSVCTVRHPCQWLQSYYQEIRGGHTGIDAVDVFKGCDFTSFEGFLYSYLYLMPGAVGNMFFSYNADSYLKLEDMPWAIEDFLTSLNVSQFDIIKINNIGPQNISKTLPDFPSPNVIKLIAQSEQELMETYDYLF